MDLLHLAQRLSSKHIIEVKIEGRIKVTGRREGRRKQLPEDVK